MSGTLRDLLFGSKSRCFECKIHRKGLGPIATSNSVANHAVLHAQNDRGCLGPIEICYSGPKVAVLHPKTTPEGWDPWRLVILMLITLFCKQKPLKWAGTNMDLIFWCKSGRFDCIKGQVRSGTHRDL